ncbi:ATP-dependent DNA helicase [Mycena venus]|uniref:ATP-dependent DNA helicase n=1 Tax=Mycena venus TaxID=2733690 RepID=A0A8H7CTP2_9AGAR|nr:ATP-dependent DNA helicase [Mycena venus]
MSAAQKRRRRREREERGENTPPLNAARSRAQQARRQNERAGENMDIDDPPLQNAEPSRVLQVRDFIVLGGDVIRKIWTPHLNLSVAGAIRSDLGPMTEECPNCGALHWDDEKVRRSSVLDGRVFGTCCDHGKVQLQPLQEPPEPLRRLFSGGDAQALEFRSHITQYNSALAFTSLGVSDDKSINKHGPSAWIFWIQGNLYHLSGSLTAPAGVSPSYSQLYMYDPVVALQQRMNRNSGLRQDTMQNLQTLLTRFHAYAPVYKQAYEILNELGDEVEDAEIRLRVIPGNDRRRYNLPTAEEVAVVLPGDGSSGDGRDIILRNRAPAESPLLRISDIHPAYTPLYYVLLFPRGENGWHPDLYLAPEPGKQPRRLTQIRYYAFRLFPRADEFSTLLHGGRLLQQYMVDAFASVDQNRLSYLRHNQKKIRASLYNGLEDAISNRDDDVDLNELGKRYILPSSYTGGPRHMQQRYQDAMAIARFFRKVDLFVTVTANPQWPEITRALFRGQTSYDRPELVARVFELKKRLIIKEIHEDGVFGECAAYVYTIEFQKRGLPHMHMLIFLKHPWKLLSPDDIDSIISAKWPNPETQPLLFETVQRCMVHGPCGPLNPRTLHGEE